MMIPINPHQFEPMDEADDLAAAKAFVIACAIGAAIWIAGGALVVALFL